MALLERRWTAAAISERVAELGSEVAARHPEARGGGPPPVLVTVLKGGVTFLADLVRAMPLPVEVDFLAVRPMDPGARSASQQVGLAKDIEVDIAGRDVLLVEDVVGSGLTLSYLSRMLATRDPATLRACVLLDRPGQRVASLPLDHVGFTIGPERLVGYGLDLGGWFRSCPDLWEVLDERAVMADPSRALAQMRPRADPD